MPAGLDKSKDLNWRELNKSVSKLVAGYINYHKVKGDINANNRRTIIETLSDVIMKYNETTYLSRNAKTALNTPASTSIETVADSGQLTSISIAVQAKNNFMPFKQEM